jgi:hypothetical protein
LVVDDEVVLVPVELDVVKAKALLAVVADQVVLVEGLARSSR